MKILSSVTNHDELDIIEVTRLWPGVCDRWLLHDGDGGHSTCVPTHCQWRTGPTIRCQGPGCWHRPVYRPGRGLQLWSRPDGHNIGCTRWCPTENICSASGAFPKLIVHGIKHCGQYKYLNGLARINCNLAQALLATPKLWRPFSKSFIAGKWSRAMNNAALNRGGRGAFRVLSFSLQISPDVSVTTLWGGWGPWGWSMSPGHYPGCDQG